MSIFLFYVITAFVLFSAYFVVTAHNLFRCAVGLIAVLFGVAGMYLLMNAQFLSAVQVIVYVGGIVVLIVYVVLLVADVTQTRLEEGAPWRKAAAGMVASALFLVLAGLLIAHGFGAAAAEPQSTSVAEIGRALLRVEHGGFILAFEAVSLVLIAALVGAVTIASAFEKEETHKTGKKEISTP